MEHRQLCEVACVAPGVCTIRKTWSFLAADWGNSAGRPCANNGEWRCGVEGIPKTFDAFSDGVAGNKLNDGDLDGAGDVARRCGFGLSVKGGCGY